MTSQKSFTVLVTRPGEAGQSLCEAIASAGGSGKHCPTIAFESILDDHAINEALTQLTAQDWFIFISPQAVRSVANAFKTYWQPHIKLAAVGSGTKNALEKLGFSPVLSPSKDMGSDALLALTAFVTVEGQHITIVRGEGGRESLADTLIARGAHVSHLVAYRRILPTIGVTPFIAQLKTGKLDVVVCTSGEGVQNLKQLMGDAGWADLKRLPIIVVSERIKMLAHHLGFQTIWVASDASNAAILDQLAQIREGKSDERQ